MKKEYAVEVAGLCKTYMMNNRELPVLDEIHLAVDAGEFITIIGPSGCGKSTLFRTVAGLEKDFDGVVKVNGIEVQKERPMLAYMLQKDLLLPWRTVWRNILLPLELAGTLKTTDTNYLNEMAEAFGLSGFLDAYPDELSGGMRQRTALLRTWLMNGSVMLLDEPFGALDAITRNQMQDWLIRVWENHRKTVLFITHDIEEAVYLSDKIFVMSTRPGRIVGEIPIDFERPRKREMLYSNGFLSYKRQLMSALQVL